MTEQSEHEPAVLSPLLVVARAEVAPGVRGAETRSKRFVGVAVRSYVLRLIEIGVLATQ